LFFRLLHDIQIVIVVSVFVFLKGAQADPRPQGRNEDTEGVSHRLPYMAKEKMPEP
jgi:hypothetical protein